MFADGRVYVPRLKELGDPRHGVRRAPTRFALRCCEQTWRICIRRYRAAPQSFIVRLRPLSGVHRVDGRAGQERSRLLPTGDVHFARDKEAYRGEASCER